MNGDSPVEPQQRPAAEPSGSATAEPVSSLDEASAGRSSEMRAGNVPPLPLPRWKWPLVLLVITAASTFYVGSCQWVPGEVWGRCAFAGDLMPARQAMLTHWRDGAIFTAAILSILMAHEMGHFLAATIHRVPATLPYFIPMPLTPLGTLGAIILGDGSRYNRRQLFDIAVAGPLAGLVLAVPIMWVGVSRLDLSTAEGMYSLDLPLLARAMAWLQGMAAVGEVDIASLGGNPYFMAGWAGLLITGLNMLPVSQLDGGHVAYTVLGFRRARTLAMSVMLGGGACLIMFPDTRIWLLMLVLILLMGPTHPPVAHDDGRELGPIRRGIGYASLAIPILCFAYRGIMMPG